MSTPCAIATATTLGMKSDMRWALPAVVGVMPIVAGFILASRQIR
jgi:hypothetical protein